MEKSKLDIATKEPVSFYFGKAEILVNPYISLMDQSVFMRDYITQLFLNDELTDNYILAEWALMLAIIDKNTNVEVLNGENSIDFSTIVSSGLWYQIKDYIRNYNDFMDQLNVLVAKLESKKVLEKSIGVTIDKIADQVFLFLDQFSELDLSEAGIKNLTTALNGLKEVEAKKETRKPKAKKETV